MKIDMHVHTHYSGDSNMSPEELIAAARARGLDGLAVTDHGTVKGAIETEKIARDSGLLIIPGQEIKTQSGEIIVLGIREDIESHLSLEETCKWISRQGGFLIIPHPFDRFRSGIGDRIKRIEGQIDAIEAFNSRILFNSFNKKAEEFAVDSGIPVVAGSDAHFPEEVGNAYTVLDCKPREEDVLRAIRDKGTKLVTNKTGLKRYPKTLVLKIRRALLDQR